MKKVPLLISKISQKRYPFPLNCSDLSLTLKKAPFSENSRTCMVTHRKSDHPGDVCQKWIMGPIKFGYRYSIV